MYLYFSKDSVIAILLENIKPELIRDQMRYLLLTKTYIKWPRSERKRRRFWKALEKALTPPPQGRYDDNPEEFLVNI